MQLRLPPFFFSSLVVFLLFTFCFLHKAGRYPVDGAVLFTGYTLFFFIRTNFIRTLMLRFAPKFKKMYGRKKEHPQAQPDFTRSYKEKSVFMIISPNCLFFRGGARHVLA